MIPYVSIVKYQREDEDFQTTFLRVSSIDDGIQDIPLMPVQQVLLASELLKNFELDCIDNG